MLRTNCRLGACCHIRRQQVVQQQHIRLVHTPCTVNPKNSTATEAPPTGLLSAADLEQYIRENDIQASLVPQPASIPAQQVIKSMVLVIKKAAAPTPAASTAPYSDPKQGYTAASADTSSSLLGAAAGAAAGAADCGGGGAAGASAAAAVLVLVSGAVRVDVCAVADHLGLPRSHIRLASRQEAAGLTGYDVGAIPPFGHRTPLRTLVDQSITRQVTHSEQQQPMYMYAGGGSPDTQLLLSVPQLLAATAAETGVFSETQPQGLAAAAADGASGGNGNSTRYQGAADAAAVNALVQQQQQQQQRHLSWAEQLPLPWPPGSGEVHLVGVVAQRRRIAKLLLFCSLVPEGVPPLPADGTAAYVRRLWRHPDPAMNNTPCEVQIIMGKTIERSLGREAAAALFDHIKVGCVVSVWGRLQHNPAVAEAKHTPDDTNSNSNSTSSSSSGRAPGPGLVLDVVAAEVVLLHKNRDMLAKAIREAQRKGMKQVNTATQLHLHLQLQGPGAMQEAAAAAADAGAAGVGSVQLQPSSSNPPANRSTPASVHSAAAATAAGKLAAVAAGSRTPASAVKATASRPRTPTATAAAAVAARDEPGVESVIMQYWCLPLDMDRVHWVCHLQGIRQMQQMVLPQPGVSQPEQDGNSRSGGSSSYFSGSSSSSGASNGNGAGVYGSSTMSSGSSSSREAAHDIVVGLDCEWKPYDHRASPTNPVALLQLATREHVFLIDLLAICQQQQAAQELQAEQAPSDGSGQVLQQQQQAQDGKVAGWLAASSSSSSSGGDGVCCELTPAEEALGLFLLQLLSSPQVIKLGFGLSGDLERLQQSYPQLPCFQPLAVAAAGIAGASPATGAAPLARHLDLLHFGRRAVPNLVKVYNISLSKLVETLLGKPLDKTQQTSNWEQRPLSLQQQQYAATDAHVLTVLYDELLRRLPVALRADVLDSLAAASAAKYVPVTLEPAGAEAVAVGVRDC